MAASVVLSVAIKLVRLDDPAWPSLSPLHPAPLQCPKKSAVVLLFERFDMAGLLCEKNLKTSIGRLGG